MWGYYVVVNSKHIHIKNSIQKQDNQFVFYTNWLIVLHVSPESIDNMNLRGDIKSKQEEK